MDSWYHILLFRIVLPDHLNIKHDPVHLKPGDQATLTCEATSSNPALKMSWWHQGVPVSEGINSYTKPGLHGGKLSTIQLTFNVTPEVDGSLYMCQGSNPLMSKNIHKEVTLDVYRKWLNKYIKLTVAPCEFCEVSTRPEEDNNYCVRDWTTNSS